MDAAEGLDLDWLTQIILCHRLLLWFSTIYHAYCGHLIQLPSIMSHPSYPSYPYYAASTPLPDPVLHQLAAIQHEKRAVEEARSAQAAAEAQRNQEMKNRLMQQQIKLKQQKMMMMNMQKKQQQAPTKSPIATSTPAAAKPSVSAQPNNAG